MRDDRRRNLEGRHESVGGAAADEVLASVVRQFSDRYAFIRELIQNSVDASAARIGIRMWEEQGELCVAVADDGQGMDQATLQGYLLTLFRTTKEHDLTKIGKFGIGFASIFAMGPREVVVDTGRDSVWHRVTFDAALNYTLSRRREPFEGTTVTLRIPGGTLADAARIQETAARWCRFAAATISVSGTWEGTISEPFGVDGPVVVPVAADGVRGAVAVARDGVAGFYNRGILLWEGESPIPGVTFRVDGRHLGHTLTRDNVSRDRHFAAVMRLVEGACRRLDDAVHAEAEAAAVAGDLARVRRLFDTIGDVPWDWDERRAILPGACGPVSLRAIRRERSWLARLRGETPQVAWSGAPLEGTSRAVLLADGPDDPHVRFVCSVVGGVPVEFR